MRWHAIRVTYRFFSYTTHNHTGTYFYSHDSQWHHSNPKPGKGDSEYMHSTCAEQHTCIFRVMCCQLEMYLKVYNMTDLSRNSLRSPSLSMLLLSFVAIGFSHVHVSSTRSSTSRSSFVRYACFFCICMQMLALLSSRRVICI